MSATTPKVTDAELATLQADGWVLAERGLHIAEGWLAVLRRNTEAQVVLVVAAAGNTSPLPGDLVDPETGTIIAEDLTSRKNRVRQPSEGARAISAEMDLRLQRLADEARTTGQPPLLRFPRTGEPLPKEASAGAGAASSSGAVSQAARRAQTSRHTESSGRPDGQANIGGKGSTAQSAKGPAAIPRSSRTRGTPFRSGAPLRETFLAKGEPTFPREFRVGSRRYYGYVAALSRLASAATQPPASSPSPSAQSAAGETVVNAGGGR